MSETAFLGQQKGSAHDSPPTLNARATYSVETNKYSPVGDQLIDATGYEHSSSVLREKIVSMTYTTFVSLANAASMLDIHQVIKHVRSTETATFTHSYLPSAFQLTWWNPFWLGCVTTSISTGASRAFLHCSFHRKIPPLSPPDLGVSFCIDQYLQFIVVAGLTCTPQR